MSSTWHAVLIRCRYEPRALPYILGIIRVAICFFPITGYLHPDEFFQSTDIIGGRHYDSQIQPTWEFTTDKPIRCMLIPVILNKIAFLLARAITSEPSAYLLLVAPRLVYTLASFIIDYCLYKMCQYYSSRGLWFLPVSIIYQSSFVCLACLTRTLSNVIEAIIFSLLLVVVCQLVRPRFRVLFVTPTRSRPAQEQVKKSTQLVSSASIGFLLALGTFNRPTFPCFAFVPMLYWTYESFKRNSYNVKMNIQRVLLPSTFTFTLTSLSIVAFDTYYYSVEDDRMAVFSESLRLLTRLDFGNLYRQVAENWVFSPYNFIKYNSNSENLANHTLHPPYMHALVNVPLAFNVLGLMFYGKLTNIMIGSGVFRLLSTIHRVYSLMIMTVLTSIILLSFIPHQEFRFLIPLIVPLAYAFGFNVYASNRWLSMWLVINLTLTYFYSSVHQSGVVKAAIDLDPILKLHLKEKDSNRTIVDVLAFRCYMVPTYQWNIPNGNDHIRLSLQQTHSDLMDSLEEKIHLSLRHYEDQIGLQFPTAHELYIMLPSFHVPQFEEYISHQLPEGLRSSLRTLKQYAPHFSFEDLNLSWRQIRQFGLRTWRDAFGLSLVKLSLHHTSANPLGDSIITSQ